MQPPQIRISAMFRWVLISGLIFSATAANAAIIGTANSTNAFPFNLSASGPGTRYQQSYAASNFTGAVEILGIRFFKASGSTLRVQDMDLWLSTGANGVNALDPNAFDNNLGADNTLFISQSLGNGAVGDELTFTGVNPFTYNPAFGDLLIDMQFSNIGADGDVSFDEDDNNGGIMSRAHNFGTAFVNRGLVTEFITGPVQVVPIPASLVLFGSALIGLTARRSRR